MAPPLREPRPISKCGATITEIACSDRSRCRSSLCRLLHFAIQDGSGRTGCDPDCFPCEWALIDTRNQAANEFIVRHWVDRDGRSTRLLEPPISRGGFFAIFATCAASVSVGRVAGGVDHGVGLLLSGIASVLAIPLPSRAATALDANWLCVMSRSPSDFRNDAEIERLMLLVWVILLGPLTPEEPHEYLLAIRARAPRENVQAE